MALLLHMGVSLNGGTPKSSILIGFSIINHLFWGTPIFGNTHNSEKNAVKVDGNRHPQVRCFSDFGAMIFTKD